MVGEFISLGVGFVALLLLSLLGFAGLNWLNVGVGSVVDWLLGGAVFWWLLVIVTVPWNVHFEAKQVLAEAELSQDKAITIDPQKLAYAQRLAGRSLWVALILHGLSTLGLYGLAATGISTIGYVSSGAALLLTGLRPAIAAYQYFMTRLSLIRQEFKYPRQDVFELGDRVMQLEGSTQTLQDQLNPELDYSWITNQTRSLEDLRKDLARLNANLEELRATNQTDHDRLSREARSAIAQLSSDSEFLDHVREILRFFKNA